MTVGRVKWFDNRKGWGFVVQPDGTDLFVHYTAIVGEGFKRLEDGEEVEYEEVDGPKGRQAGNVRPLGRPAEAPGGEAAGDGTADAGSSSGEEDSGEASGDDAPSSSPMSNSASGASFPP